MIKFEDGTFLLKGARNPIEIGEQLSAVVDGVFTSIKEIVTEDTEDEEKAEDIARIIVESACEAGSLGNAKKKWVRRDISKKKQSVEDALESLLNSIRKEHGTDADED